MSTVLIVAVASRRGKRPRLRMAGLVVSGIGCGVALVGAWAPPVWMALSGAGFALVGVTAGSVHGRLLSILAAAQLIATAVLIAGIEAEVGHRDEWGDYPAAGGIALVVRPPRRLPGCARADQHERGRQRVTQASGRGQDAGAVRRPLAQV